MAEVKTLVWMKPIKYSGLFDLKELYATIDKWCKEHHYDKVEAKNFEDVYEDSKQIILELRPYKKITDYAKVEIRAYMEFTDIKEEVVERGGLKKKINKGKINMSFDCYLITDYEAHWETKAVYYFFRMLVDKFIYRGYMKRFEAEAVADCNEMIHEVKSYLNMERFK